MKPNIAFPLTPALLAFGPLFIVMGLRSDPPFLAYLGSVMLTVGLMVLFGMSASALKQLQEIEVERTQGDR